MAAAALSMSAFAAGRAPDLGGLPSALAVPWLVVRRVGLPFVMLATQRRCSHAGRSPSARPSQTLYAVSNAGALVGLLAYPTLLERFVGLSAQLALWAAGFVLFSLCIGPVCVLLAARARPRPRLRPRCPNVLERA